MKIIEVKQLKLPGVFVIRYGKFADHRGYFSEPYRHSDLFNHQDLKQAFKGIEFLQVNESYSKAGVSRGLHFQWDPPMGKLLRTISGRMIDIFMDIRKGSPNYGKIGMYDLTADREKDYSEWIWVPAGFAHGNFFTVETYIEYFCSAEYSPTCEAGISPLSQDLDWSLCDTELKNEFETIKPDLTLSDKDRFGMSLTDWTKDKRSEQFVY
jgi:dTDP-4-dehydrorhamnose 3,5-epimerase